MWHSLSANARLEIVLGVLGLGIVACFFWIVDMGRRMPRRTEARFDPRALLWWMLLLVVTMVLQWLGWLG